MSEIEYFYSAHSVFAYIGSSRLAEIAAAAGRRIVHKPVYLNGVVSAVSPGGFRARSKAHNTYYFAREIERWAEYRNVPIKHGFNANHFHDTSLVNAMLIAGAADGGNVDGLAHAFLEAHWLQHADLADESVLRDVATSAGFDAPSLLEAARAPEVKAVYEANTAEAIERSVFGSPTYFVDGDMFYGQDRLDQVERALQQPFAKQWPKN